MMRVLVIPEDFRKDQFILDPVIKALLASVGKPNAKVRVCRDPLLGGVGEALKWDRISDIVERYKGMVDIFILAVDRDGEVGRRKRLDDIEKKANLILSDRQAFLCENAWQELEVWVLAGVERPKDWKWVDIRANPNPKEAYFAPLARALGLEDGPAGGRQVLGREAARRFYRIEQLCPEDIGNLKRRIMEIIRTRANVPA